MKTINLKESVSEIVDNRGKTCPTAETGMALIATNCVKSDYLYPSKEKVRYINEQTYSEFFRGHPVPGDLIFVTKGSPGEVCMVPDEVDFCIAQDMVALRANPKIIYPKYLFAILRSKEAQFKIRNLHVGSMIPHFKKSDFDRLELPLVNKSKQQFIGDFYYSISKKIERNTKMNETLEEIAKTLFKSWFIDFDPVRAKAEGRPTGLPKEISDLFPDSFQDSELDEMPKGWNLLTFGDFVTPIRGKVITKKTTNPGDIPVVAGGLKPAYFHSIANVEGPAITISASGANAGYTNLYFEDIWASDCSYISNKQSSNVFTSYIFLKLNQERIFDSQHGAAQPHIYPDDLRRLDMVIPSNDLYATFENLITSFFNKIKLNIEETKNLISLRDALLPKLISGELQIPDAENLVEEAGI